MPDVGLVRFGQVALDVAQATVPCYRTAFSKHQFTQPQLLAILCLMRYEDWTFRCGSPALLGKQYCHFHAETHAPTVELPLIEDEQSLRVAFARLAHQVAANKILPAQAKVLLQILESAGRSLASDAG